jgi:hypothetical protein
MDMLDKFQRIAWYGQSAAAILGNGAEFQLVDVADVKAIPNEDHRQQLLARGFRFIGIVGLIEGSAKIALAEPLDDTTTAALAQAYLVFIEQRINKSAKPVGDGADWITRLYQLPDTREN